MLVLPDARSSGCGIALARVALARVALARVALARVALARHERRMPTFIQMRRHQMQRHQMRRHLARSCAALVLLLPRAAYAHPGRAPEPHDLWQSWTFPPVVVIGLALGAWCYARGVRALWRRAGTGRGVPGWRAASFAGGLAAVAVALLSPVDRVASALFSVHMVQHLLLVLVAAPLIVLGEPLAVTMWALPVRARRAVARAWRRAPMASALWLALRHPATAWSLHVVALWLWHAPRLYDAALGDNGVHELEHASFFLTALLFWMAPFDRHRHRLGLGAASLYLFAAGLQGTILGALMTLARHPLYQAHLETTARWGLTPLEDQQLAGLIMWIPAGLVYLGALIPFAFRALGGDAEHSRIGLPPATPRPG